VRAKLIALACTRPPDTDEGVRRERFTHAELAERVGMSESQAHAILRGADIRPHLTEYWVMSELGPDFDARAADVCGLYLDPPQNAIVVSIDEKTSIAAREPARPDRLAVTGRPARRDSEYIRNGTANLFAALQVHHGEVSGMTSPEASARLEGLLEGHRELKLGGLSEDLRRVPLRAAVLALAAKNGRLG